MPPPKKVDLLPPDLRQWLDAELRKRGFADYVELADALNTHLAERGEELRIQKSALAEHGAAQRAFHDLNQHAATFADDWIENGGIADAVKQSNVIEQMLKALAFKLLSGRLREGDDDMPDAKEMRFVADLLSAVQRSTALGEKIKRDAQTEMIAKMDDAVAAGDINKAAADAARKVLGFAA